jgi:hypothetical protein
LDEASVQRSAPKADRRANLPVKEEHTKCSKFADKTEVQNDPPREEQPIRSLGGKKRSLPSRAKKKTEPASLAAKLVIEYAVAATHKVLAFKATGDAHRPLTRRTAEMPSTERRINAVLASKQTNAIELHTLNNFWTENLRSWPLLLPPSTRPSPLPHERVQDFAMAPVHAPAEHESRALVEVEDSVLDKLWRIFLCNNPQMEKAEPEVLQKTKDVYPAICNHKEAGVA